MSFKSRGLFKPDSEEPLTLSRTKVDLFVQCPRCFYLDRRLGVSRPSLPGFSLNNAVDALLKKEFDLHRAAGSSHPLMKIYGIDAVPYRHPDLNEWRNSLSGGIGYFDKETNLFIRGGVDDVWVNKDGELHVVDYKSTAKNGKVSIEGEYQKGYKRQVEIYQWLFLQNGFKVSPIAYFVYCNGRTDREAFDGKLEFSVEVIPYAGTTSWIPGVLKEIKSCLLKEDPPPPAPTCEYCSYQKATKEIAID
ncbi:MAG: PD-(D/E)XK nuclease family protein [Patescibacteria group bacterium]|nr:PD-(D/E)XK nuclease family protein [Patescibacteria group bacterium]